MASDEWVVLRLKVQDRNRFIADTAAAGGAVRALGRDADSTGRLFQQGAHHGFLWNQMLFTLRRTIYGLTLGVSALGAAAIVSGFGFNSLIEQQTLAFKTMTGSAQLASKEVTFLFNLAAHGPFEFAPVITAARQLQAFGFDITRTNTLLTSLQDAMAGMGLDQSGLDRATLALGQIQSSGRILGQEVRQLEQLGLFNPQDFARRLHFDPRQLGNIGALNIPSKVAIDAIMAYWREHFKGAAKEFQKTWTGELSTLRDIGRQTFGVMVLPLQQRLERNVLPLVTKIAQKMQTGFKTGGFAGALGVLDARFGTNLVGIWNNLIFVGTQLFSIWRQLGRAFLDAWQMLGIGSNVLVVIGALLWGLAHVLQVLNPILKYLILLWIIDRTAVLAVAAATKIKLFWDTLEVAMTERKVFWTKAITLWRGREAAATLISVGALKKWAFAQKAVLIGQAGLDGVYTMLYKNNGMMARFSRTIFTRVIPALTGAAAAAWGFTLALLANPITWIVLAAVAVGVLYWRWKAFRDVVNDTFRFMWVHPLVSMIVPVLGPLFRLVQLFRDLWGFVARVYGTIAHGHLPSAGRGGFGWKDALHIGGGVLGIPGLATGGHVLTGGMAIVGEHGAEVVHVPGGATVAPIGQKPLADIGSIFSGLRGGIMEVTIPLYLDRRKLAEANASVELDSLARA